MVNKKRFKFKRYFQTHKKNVIIGIIKYFHRWILSLIQSYAWKTFQLDYQILQHFPHGY